MNRLRCILLLQFATTMALGQAAHPGSLPTQPKALVRSLYTEVVARRPIGIPKGPDMKVLAPFLSTALLHKINLAYACEGDFFRQNPDPHLKPAFEWLDLGLFTGDEEMASPTDFHIESVQPDEDGATRVRVKLLVQEPHDRPWKWYVAAVVIREGGHYVLDDVVYLRDKHTDGYRLSQALSWGCDGPRWIGYPKRLTHSRPQK